jgi:hypothetical protein
MYQQQGAWCAHPDRQALAKKLMHKAGVASSEFLIAFGKVAGAAEVVQAIQSSANQPRSASGYAGTPLEFDTADFPASDANVVADKCQQIGEMRAKRGADQSEPEWFNALGIVLYCKNGEQVAHDWSSGHSGYSQSATERKIVYRQKFPPTTCDQFRITSPEGCAGCTQTCRSPITLGWIDSTPAVSDAEMDAAVEPFEVIASDASDVVLEGEVIQATTVKKSRAKRAASTVDITEPLAHLQERFGLINFDGKLWVIDLTTLNARTNQGIVKKLSLSNRSDGSLLLARALKAADFYTDGGQVLGAFYTSPDTKFFDGVEFNPKGGSGSSLNLWVGPTIAPKQGNWQGIQAFLLEIICAGDERNFQYLLRFIAHALQRPEEKPGILVIMLGGQGTGKGTLGKILRGIWNATYLHVHDIGIVVGTFNASLERAFIIFLDEAMFAGDRKGSDSLKSVVTEEFIHVNEKHQPSRQVQSFHRFFAASNATHLKNTERDDRRDFVLRVSEARKGDHPYWHALNTEMENGGVAAMAHDLLAMDLSAFNVRAKPNTGELVEQKLLSLDPIARYWYECLQRDDLGEEGSWPDFFTTDGIITGTVDLAGNRLYRKPSASEVVKAVLKMCPSATKGQKQDKWNRARGLNLPERDVARAEFAKFIGGDVTWD